VWLLNVTLAALSAAPNEADAQGDERRAPESPRVVGVHLVSRVGDSGAADDRPKRALARESVQLHAVLMVREGGKLRAFSDVPVVQIGRQRHTARPLAEAPTVRLSWFKVEPRVETMSNTESGTFRFESIPYGETKVAAWQGKSSVTADVHPTLTTDRGQGTGTMRFRLEAATPDGVFSTPGTSARRGKGSGGLTDAVHRISIRRDDSYLGYLTELNGQPYIWASAGTSARTHQSERLEGADCADFVVYGRRRMGEDRAYTWTGSLPDVTRLLARGAPGSGGVYVDQRGEPLPYTRAGDLLLFPRHVGVLVADRGRAGVLDHEDVMFHAFFASPREQAVGQSDYKDAPIEIRRWR
jgi:hypothetical protein